ncbi:MAG: arginase family protein, partial [Candidatus Natronoplasma sp.]
MTHETAFAGAISDFKDADYSIVGVPYDGTSSFRLGSKKGPDRIREASYCFEPYLFEYDICLRDVALHDHGDISRVDDHFRLKDSLKDTIRKIVSRKKFPIVLGGEHSISPIVVSALKEEHEDLNVLILDAHLDFRDEYEGMKHSHATTSRRISEIVGLNNTFVYGVRSKA